MFGFLKKAIHESVEKQREEVEREPIGPLALSGEDCNQISNAQGPFGRSYNNPIPVNGLVGTYKYLGKLLSPAGHVLYFHRIGCISSDTCANPVDAYEIVDMQAAHWDILFLDMYHPRRSNHAPDGYSLKTYDRALGDIPFTFGVDVFCPDFPRDLPETIEIRNNLPAFAQRVRESVTKGGFDRPNTQEMHLSAVMTRLMAWQT